MINLITLKFQTLMQIQALFDFLNKSFNIYYIPILANK